MEKTYRQTGMDDSEKAMERGTEKNPSSSAGLSGEKSSNDEPGEPSGKLDSVGMGILPWLVAMAFFMQMLDATILNTALPSMAENLKVDPLRMQSVVIAYILTTALLIPASGWLAERYGSRLMFLLSIILFTLGSLLCAISTSLEFLVASRVIQGMGGAIMVPVGRLAVIRAFPRYQLVQVLSFITLPGLIGPLLGPVTGGFLVQYASWHWIFIINIPVGIFGFILSLRFMPDFRAEIVDKFDTAGFLLFSCSMVLISFAMEGMGELNLPKVEALALCIIGLLLLAFYWIRAAHMEQPLFRPSLFRLRSFAVGIFGNLFSRLGSGAMPFLMPLFLQIGMGFSPIKAGLTMIPSALAAMIGKNMINKLIARFGFRNFLLINTLILGALIASFSRINEHTPYPLLLLLLAVFGVVNSMQFTAMNSVTLNDLSDKDASAGNSLLSVTMQISACTGVAVAAALLEGFNARYGLSPTPEQVVMAFDSTFIGIGVISVVTCIIFSLLPSQSGKK